MNQPRCPNQAELREFARGKTADARHEEIVAHIGHCAACQETLAARDDSEGTQQSDLPDLRKRKSDSSYKHEPGQAAERSDQAPVTHDDMAADSNDRGRPQHELQQIGPYSILETLGEGGMGTVYKAWHTKLRRHVAVKILRRERFSDPDSVTRFEREMAVLGRLDHANIVRASNADEEDGMHYLVMDYIEGADLSQLVKQHGPLSVANACEVVRQAAEGLQYAHEQGMVHRDIKPSNLLLAHEGTVKILDLGLARFLHDTVGAVTTTGQVAGTPDYMAPEQWEDSHGVDIRADIYSLGCTLFFLLCGQPPFGGGGRTSVANKMRAHLVQPPPDVRNLRPDVPPQLAAVIETAMAKLADSRFATPAALGQALQPFCNTANLCQPSPENQIDVETLVAAKDSTMLLHPSVTRVAASDSSDHRSALYNRWNLLLVAAASVLLASLFAVWRWQVDKGQGSPLPPDHKTETAVAPIEPKAKEKIRIEEFQVVHYRYDEDGKTSHRIGDIVEQRAPVLSGDEIRIEFKLDAPGYCYLFALNPDGTVQQCLPLDGTSPIREAAGSFPPASDSFFGLTDGSGQQGLVLVASHKLLPDLAAEMRWSTVKQDGVWRFLDGDIERLYGRERPRGLVVTRTAADFKRFCLELFPESDEVTITAIAFAVR